MDRLRWWNIRRRRQLVAHSEDVVPDVFYVRGDLVDQTVALLAHDLTVTLGWSVERAEGLARSEAQGKAQVDCWDDDVDLAFPLAVADDAQQFLHDTFEDTTWPACPTHLRHPLRPL
jgi:hypothetical protein